MVNRLLGFLLVVLILAQAWAIVDLLLLPASVTSQLMFSPGIQMMIGVTWLIVFGWGMIGLWRGKRFRAVFTIFGFIIYSLLQVMIFSHADYDQQREGFLLAAIGVILLLLIAAKYKENFTND